MRIFKICFSLIVFLLLCVCVDAQIQTKRDSLLNKITNIDAKLRTFSEKDTTRGFSAPLKIDTVYANQLQEANIQPFRDEKGLLLVESDWTPFPDYITFRDTVIFEPAYLPVIFEGKILSDDIDFRTKETSPNEEFHLVSPDSTFVPQLKRIEEVENMRRFYYMNNPQKIRLNALAFQNVPVIESREIEQRSPFKDLITAEKPIEFTKPDVEKTEIKLLNWLKNGEHRLQLSYNTYSDKWGGDNNFDLFSHQKFNIKYKKNKVRFDNLIEWRLQLKQLTSIDDDKEENKNKGKLNIIDDYLRTYSTFSLEAFYKKWFYSTNLEMKTPVFPKRATDVNRTSQRGFLAPFELNLGVGMRYETETTSKKDKYRKFKVSTDLSVLSVNYKYSRYDEEKIPPKNFGIEEGNSQTDLGSTFNVNLAYSHNRYTKLLSRMKYFTNYERVYVEWENSFDFAINNYFSTTLYFYLKYDDSLPEEKRNNDKIWKYFNYNQMLRFGLTYTW